MPLTQKDLSQIKDIVEETVEEKTKNLPTRDQFFTSMSELMGEVQAMREESTILSGRTSDNQERIEVLEEIHPGGKHI